MTLYKELPPFSSATTAAAAASISSQETFLSLSLSTLPRLNPSPVHWLVHSSLEILPSSSSSQLLNFSRTCLISNRSCPCPDAEKRKKQMRLWLWGDVIESVGLGARVKLKLSIGWTPFPVDFYPNCGCLLKGGHQAGSMKQNWTHVHATLFYYWYCWQCASLGHVSFPVTIWMKTSVYCIVLTNMDDDPKG